MSLRDELPVEPLAEERWDRVEKGLFAELDAGLSGPPPPAERRPWRLAGGAVAAVAIAAAAWIAWLQTDAPSHTRPLSPTRVVSADGEVETTAGDAVLRLSPDTALSILGDDVDGFLVMMEHGETSFSVPSRGDRPSFVVQAGPTLVEVVGTRFTVSYGEVTRVRVDEGVVRVAHEGETTLVHTGEHWSSIRVTAEGREALAEPQTGVPPADPAGRDARALFEEANRIEPSNPAAAIAIYKELVSRGGAWGRVALYAQAHAELERGNRQDALQLARGYLRRYPAGENADDARLLLRSLE